MFVLPRTTPIRGPNTYFFVILGASRSTGRENPACPVDPARDIPTVSNPHSGATLHAEMPRVTIQKQHNAGSTKHNQACKDMVKCQCVGTCHDTRTWPCDMP